MLQLDHVVYAVHDLDESALRFREAFGLDSSVGGRHRGFGTANRIVPLGDQYLEMVGVVDRDEAAANPFGRTVLERADAGGGWLLICVATEDVDAVADRLGLDVDEGVRERPDGEQILWRMAGLNDPRREPWMPFFITWDIPPELHPGRTRAGHGIRADGIAWVEVGGDAGRLRDWLGTEELPFRVVDGEHAIHRVAISAADGELVIE